MEDVQVTAGKAASGSRTLLSRLLSGTRSSEPLIDIGTTSLTGVRSGVIPGFGTIRRGSHVSHGTLALDPTDCLCLGSHFVRTGLLFKEPEGAYEGSVDAFGVQWQWDRGVAAPIRHPLENAELMDVAHLPRPFWQEPAQPIPPEIAERSIVIADAPCPGLLDLCFMLRNPWRLMEDIASNWRMASALLEWSQETITEAYAYMLGRLPHQPDVIVYSDDLGFDGSMFLSPADFRTYVQPRLRGLLSALRRLTSASICFHSCGAIGPILRDIVDLGIEIINVDTKARDMAARRVRQSLPASTVLHGTTDLCALGAAIENRNPAAVASLITELADSSPVIAAPTDSLSSSKELSDAVRGASFVRNLNEEDFDALRRIGPVRSIIEKALERTRSTPPLTLCRPGSHSQNEHLTFAIDPVRGQGGEAKGHTFIQ